MENNKPQQQLKKELLDFITKLHELGKEDLLCLVSLTQVVQPELDFNWRLPLLSHIFSEIPNFLEQGLDLNVVISSPPPELPYLRLLVDMFKIPPILNHLSYNSLLILTSSIPSSGSSAAVQYQMLVKLQGVFQSWSNANVRSFCELLSKTPFHLERETLLEHDPTVTSDVLPIVVKLLKSPVAELEALKIWMENLKEIDLIVMANLFQFEPSVLTKLKKHFSPSSATTPPSGAVPTSPAAGSSIPAGSTPKDMISPVSPATAVKPEILTPPPVDVVMNHNMNHNNISIHTEKNVNPVNRASLKRQRQEVTDLETPMKSLVVSSLPSLEVELFGDDAHSNGVTIVGSKQPPMDHHNNNNNTMMVPASPRKKATPPAPAPSPPIRIHTISQYKPPSPQVINPEQSVPMTAYPNQWVLKVLDKGQPPSQTVYQRILKPSPAVILLPPVQDNSHDFGFFVEASLIRSDNNTELPSTLEGTRVIRIEPGKMASFKKLKILSTTQQIGSLVRLKFQLKKANEGTFITVHGIHTVSNPIEVFSHTYYLNRVSLPTPPVVSEILPARGPACGGTRVAILGDNFIDSPNLRVRFGNTIIQPIFHESRTLICTTPFGLPQSIVLVSVSNDGVDYSTAQAQFAYY